MCLCTWSPLCQYLRLCLPLLAAWFIFFRARLFCNPPARVALRHSRQLKVAASGPSKSDEAKKKENPLLKKKTIGLLSFGEDAEQEINEITAAARGAYCAMGHARAHPYMCM